MSSTRQKDIETIHKFIAADDGRITAEIARLVRWLTEEPAEADDLQLNLCGWMEVAHDRKLYPERYIDRE